MVDVSDRIVIEDGLQRLPSLGRSGRVEGIMRGCCFQAFANDLEYNAYAVSERPPPSHLQ